MSEAAERELDKILAIPGDMFSGLRINVLAWHARWSGRPSIDQIDKTLKECDEAEFSNYGKAKAILALYPDPTPAPQKRVSRGELEKLFQDNECNLKSSYFIWLISDLCTLFGVEEKEEKPEFWCGHITWETEKASYPNVLEDRSYWYLKLRGGERGTSKRVGYELCEQAKFCPLCSAPRPAKGME